MQRTLEPEVMDTPEEADGYDAMDHSVPNAAFVERLGELGAHGGQMLDIGTGPGHIPLLAAERFPQARVVGVDLSEHMLAHAERHRAASPHGARVAFRRANARGLDFPDASFDAVFSNTILHHIPDPVPFLREARRVLRPGGVLLIRDLYRPATPERALELVALHAAGETPYNRELFRASLHAALTVEELRAVAADAGLGDAELVVDTDRHMSLQMRAAPDAGVRRG
jgi:ubiquinone/menaquinone biosynthesis C-methylase UbiE